MIVTAGGLLIWVDPSLPRMPGWLRSALAAVLLLGPPLWLAGMRIVDWLRVRDWITVYHINAVDDEREKYHVPPALWEEKTVDGPSPYPVNGGAAWEVREFGYEEESGELTVTGTWLSATVDSKLITSKAMLEDVHGSLIERALELSRLRARIEQMGVKIQEATVMELVEASERGTMLDDSAVSEAFEAARSESEADEHEDLPEINQYSDPADANATAVADGGTPEHE
jgi:hypothetical protein